MSKWQNFFIKYDYVISKGNHEYVARNCTSLECKQLGTFTFIRTNKKRY